MSSTRTWIAFMGGVATGAMLGVLFAPDTGRNTRDKLSYRLDKYLVQLKGYLAQAEHRRALAPEGDGDPAAGQDYRRAEELLREVESMLDDLKGKQPS